MTYSAPPLRIRWGFSAICAAALLALAVSLSLALTTAGVPSSPGNGHPAAATLDGGASPALVKLAAAKPAKQVEAIVQFKANVDPREARQLVRTNGGRVTGDLHVINGLVAHMTAREANRLASDKGVRAVSLNHGVKQNSVDDSKLVTSFNQSLTSDQVWDDYGTGKGIGVAVIDTGIAEDMPDFEDANSYRGESRVVATAVTNPDAASDTDKFGHGTHVAGIIAGNSNNRSRYDSLRGKYVGVAPEADLVSIKVSDDDGNATILDVIYGLQFAVDFKDDYNIRVINMSLESSVAESYKTDPLDAAAEAAWFSGHRRGRRCGQPRHRLEGRLVRARQRPVRDLGRRCRRQGHEQPQRRQAGHLVEPRQDAGRLQQAGRAGSGLGHRLDARAEQRLQVAVPDLHRRRPVHQGGRHLDGRSDGGRPRGDHARAPLHPDA